MLSDLEAKRLVDNVGEAMGLSPIERLAVRIVSKHETQYGAGWDAKHDPPRAEFGAGSNNMGAITTSSRDPSEYFTHSDSRFEASTGRVIEYQTKFSRHTTPEGGFRELAATLLFKDGHRRENVARALELGSLLELATAMRLNRYFLGTKPMPEAIEAYRAALERRYSEIKSQTAEEFFDNPKAGPGSPGASGSDQQSQSSEQAHLFLQRLSGSLPVLRRGVRGNLVGVLQFELGIDPDEIFGAKTLAALLRFQTDNGISGDVSPSGAPLDLGACGVKTWAALFAVPHAESVTFEDFARVGEELRIASEHVNDVPEPTAEA